MVLVNTPEYGGTGGNHITFTINAQANETAVHELGHTFGSVLHKMYPDILFGLNADHDKTLIKQLEVVEDETLKAMQTALSTIESPMLKSILLDLYPRLNRCHDDVWHLDQAC